MKNNHVVDNIYNIDNDCILLIILYNDKIVGTAGIVKLSNDLIKMFQKNKLDFEGKKTAYLQSMGILKEYRGKGLSK